MDNKKFIAETKDVRLTVKRADTFGVSFVNCEQDILRVEKVQNVIRLIQTKKSFSFELAEVVYSGYS